MFVCTARQKNTIKYFYLQFQMPEWSQIKDPHKTYPAATSAITIKFDPQFGRHVVANRDIEVGEVIFNEDPIVTYFSSADDELIANPACLHCFHFIHSGIVPCPTCSTACFCRLVA